MKNPWESISLDDYENHMKLDSVMQLQAMNRMMKGQFYKNPFKTVMIFGIAGGNGLEHVDTDKIDTVYGIDINQDYLNECRKRYPELEGHLKCICADLTEDNTYLPEAELVVANLLIEYIGYECFLNAVKKVRPDYVSCIIQINTDDSFVSDSPYLHAFDDLDRVHHQMDEETLEDKMKSINYILTGKTSQELPNGKKLVQMDFRKGE